MPSDIVIEAQAPGDAQTTFRVCIDSKVIATGVTELQAQFLASELRERMQPPGSSAARRREQP
jgi:hypothetical protein